MPGMPVRRTERCETIAVAGRPGSGRECIHCRLAVRRYGSRKKLSRDLAASESMREVDPKLVALTDTEIVLEFRNALVALLPICQRLQLLPTDDQPYDDFEELAAYLWRALVVEALPWKYGFDVQIPAYGSLERPTAAPFVVAVVGDAHLPFAEFAATRAFGDEPFNAVVVFGETSRQTISLQTVTRFELVRG